jgi:hypothetical protein
MITYLDGNSYSFVDRAEIYVGSNLLYNSGNNLHQCYGVNRDFQEDPSTSRASDSILAGSLNVNYATDVLSTYSAQATVRAGAIMGSSGTTLANRRVFSVPLLDPCLGTGNTKFFPLASMLNNTMTYDFYLTSPNNVLHTIDASGTLNYTGSYQVKARLVLLCYELDSQASNMVRQVGAGSDGITRINTNSWKTSLFSIAAGSTSVSIQVPFKVSSLKNLIFVMKNSSENNNARAQYISQRSKAFLQSYQLYASNGQLIPSTPVSLTADVNEAFNETALCFYSSTNITQVPSLISWSSFSNDARWFQTFQSIDFTAMQGITGALSATHSGTMCNGANLAYTRKAFNAVNGFNGIDDIASGDDMLLMHKIEQRFPRKTSYLKCKDAIVYTSPMPTLKTFLQQRTRWASKANTFEDKRITAVLAIVYLFNLLFPVLLIASFFNNQSISAFIFLWLLKTALEVSLLLPVSAFFHKKKELTYFALLQFIHIPYVLYAGLRGQTGTYEWKGRQVR